MIKALFIACLFLIPTTEKLKTYVNTEQKYSISYPETWEQSDYSDAMLFLSPLDNETDSFRENLNVIVQDLSKHPMTLKEYDEMSKNQLKTMLGVESFLSVKDIKVNGIKATELIYEMKKNIANGVPNDLKLKQVWFVHSGKAFLLTYTAQKETYDRYSDLANSCLVSIRLQK